MNQYFFKMNQAERNSILDQHRKIYDGYVTQFGQTSNSQPLYIQDYANDKGGLVVSNNGSVKPYTNVGINESHSMLDKIADGPYDLKNGTVDFGGTPDMSDVNREYFHDTYPSPNEEEFDFISLGKNDEECKHCDDDNNDIVIDIDESLLDDSDEISLEDDIELGFTPNAEIYQELPIEEIEDFSSNLQESLSMFRRIIK